MHPPDSLSLQTRSPRTPHAESAPLVSPVPRVLSDAAAPQTCSGALYPLSAIRFPSGSGARLQPPPRSGVRTGKKAEKKEKDPGFKAPLGSAPVPGRFEPNTLKYWAPSPAPPPVLPAPPRVGRRPVLGPAGAPPHAHTEALPAVRTHAPTACGAAPTGPATPPSLPTIPPFHHSSAPPPPPGRHCTDTARRGRLRRGRAGRPEHAAGAAGRGPPAALGGRARPSGRELAGGARWRIGPGAARGTSSDLGRASRGGRGGAWDGPGQRSVPPGCGPGMRSQGPGAGLCCTLLAFTARGCR